MASKEDLLVYLDQHRDRFVGGDELMKQLSISRAALWKAIRSLRTAGYPILSEHGLGYRLDEQYELYTAAALQARLSGAAASYTLDVRPTLASTNITLRAMAQAGAPNGTVLIANKQSAGYGRLQRSFFSPTGGIYMSLLIRGENNPTALLNVTTTAAVAVVDTVKTLTGQDAGIKWVNDVYLNEKKICGILCEAAWTPDGKPEYLILGIGINVFTPISGFPPEIRDIAGAVYPSDVKVARQRSDFVVALLQRLAELLPCSTSPAVHAAYCKACFLPGRTVSVVRVDGSCEDAVVLGIDEQYRLLVRYSGGRTEALFSGEVTIRPFDARKNANASRDSE